MLQAGNITGKGTMKKNSNVHLHSETIFVTPTDCILTYSHPDSRTDGLCKLNMTGWPHIVFDVSSYRHIFMSHYAVFSLPL